MLVEIRKGGFVNKGAELMLLSVLEKVRSVYPDAEFAMAPGTSLSSAPYGKRAELGFYQKSWLWRHGIQWGDLAALAPKRLREMYGVVLDKEIDVVLDTAGFAYSDQWGVQSTTELARSARRWKRTGAKVVLLPQAFGPFRNEKMRTSLRKALKNIDLIFARDERSYSYLVEAVGNSPKVRLAPDFTNLIAGTPPAAGWISEQVCIVPNCRMLDKTDAATASAYVPFLIKCISELKALDRSSFILIHEGAKDEAIAQEIALAVGPIEIVRESDARKIKGILGASYATIGSRFHGLVSALSQGVPSIGTGWSHKYEALFADYQVDDCIVSITAPTDEVRESLVRIVDPVARLEIVRRLEGAAAALKLKSEAMWTSVFEELEK